jgi:hypothetical protein
VESLLAPLTDAASPWHSMAREILAYEDLREGKTATALKTYEELQADPNVPSALRTRATAMVKFLKAGGDTNFGSVAPPKPAQSPTPSSKTTGGQPVR